MAEGKALSLKDASADTFREHIGSTFKTNVFAGKCEAGSGIESSGDDVELELVECEEGKDPHDFEMPDTENAVARTPFCIVFRGPDNYPFPDGIYDLSHPKLGEIKGIAMSRETCAKGEQSMLAATFG